MTEKELSAWKKERPVYRGVFTYFPDALLEVAYCSYIGNQKHSPGSEEIKWVRDASNDHPDALLRHLSSVEKSELDDDGIMHAAKVAWRSLAFLQTTLDKKKEDGEYPIV